MNPAAPQPTGPRPVGGPDAGRGIFDTTVLDPSSLDVAHLVHWLTTAAWASAALSVLGILYGVVMLAFGSRRASGVIIGGIVGALVAALAASTVIPHLYALIPGTLS